jgi:hypothetical protein
MLCLYCGQSLTKPPICCEDAVEDYSNDLLNESSEDICTDLQEELKDFEVPIVKLNVDIKKTTDIENHIFYGIMGFWAGMTVTMLFLIWII